ncbi:MAG: cupin domain-containing protein [Halovenus sp.]|uniref:cupin domain-containing protein n=1 Tax=Halovenus amylolytica TaxID=2500550 RepID=UPI000FE3F542
MVETNSLDELTATPHARPFEAGDPAVIRLQLDAGEQVDPHTHPEKQIVIYVRSGQLNLTLDDEMFSFEAGDIVRFDGRTEVSPRAVEDSEALIVLAERAE